MQQSVKCVEETVDKVLDGTANLGLEERDQTLVRVVRRLMDTYGMEAEEARIEAAQAIARVQSKTVNGYIDLDKCTKSCVFVVIDGVTRVLTLDQIVRTFET